MSRTQEERRYRVTRGKVYTIAQAREDRDKMIERNRRNAEHLTLEYGYNPRVQDFLTEKRRREWGGETPPHPILHHDGDTDEIDGIEYKLVIHEDYDQGIDDEVLGTITESPTMRSSWKIDPDLYYQITGEHGYFTRIRELWWNPMEEVEELASYYHKAGASKQVAREKAQAAEKSAMKRRLGFGDNWQYVTVEVTASLFGVELGANAVGGVESDFLENGYSEHLIPELAGEALEEAKTRIRALAGLRG